MLEVWVGQTCTLKCKDCLHMIPYIHPKLYDIDELIRHLNLMFQMCTIDCLSVVGGEPFTNKKIVRLINYINHCASVPKAKIISNGTIIPDDDCVAELLKSDKIDIHLDLYPGNDERIQKTYSYLIERNVRCELYRYDHNDEMRWKYLGENHIKKRNWFQTKKSHSHCVMSSVYTLSNGIFVSCPRGITTKSVYHQERFPFEYVKIDDVSDLRKGKAELAVCTFGIKKEYCQFCYGVTRNNPVNVTPGIQIGVEYDEQNNADHHRRL